MTTIKIPAVKSTKVIVQEVNEVIYADGIVIKVEGANNATTRKPLYLAALDSKNSTITPPVIIPSPNKPREISYADYAKLEGVEGVEFIVTGTETNQTANHRDIKNCSFDLSKVKVKDSYQALLIHGKSINARYKGLTLQNISGYQIQTVQADKVIYKPGIEGTFIDRLSFDGFSFDGGGRPFHSDGNVRSINVHDGIIANFNFTNNVIKNIPGAKNMVYLGNGFDFNIVGNRLSNINKANNEDNGLFYLKATGYFGRNFATNYQGYLLRNWLHYSGGMGSTVAEHNIVDGGDKYGQFELQLPQVMVDQGARPANARINNNTALNLNKTNDWAGSMLTLYSTGGTVEFANNLGARLVGIKDNRATRDYDVINKSKMIFGMYGAETKLIVSGQNIYKNTVEEAVNSSTFESKFKGIGALL